jgi:predicted RNA-binding protein
VFGEGIHRRERRRQNGKLLVVTLFGEKREIAASIKEIDFKSSSIMLEEAGS